MEFVFLLHRRFSRATGLTRRGDDFKERESRIKQDNKIELNNSDHCAVTFKAAHVSY